ncbi:hypothetical protein SK128_021107, partial [Halocaridina rubra]
MRPGDRFYDLLTHGYGLSLWAKRRFFHIMPTTTRSKISFVTFLEMNWRKRTYGYGL